MVYPFFQKIKYKKSVYALHDTCHRSSETKLPMFEENNNKTKVLMKTKIKKRMIRRFFLQGKANCGFVIDRLFTFIAHLIGG